MRQQLRIAVLAAALLMVASSLAALERAHGFFTIPWYEVSPVRATVTTLFAVTNVGNQEAKAEIRYYDHVGTLLLTELRVLVPNETFTRNVFDIIPFPTMGDATGYIEIEGKPGPLLAVDYFQVDQTNQFASGDRALANDDDIRCHEVQVRFLNGGTFSGGTDFVVFFLGNDPAKWEFGVDYYDEAGHHLKFEGPVKSTEKVGTVSIASANPGAPFGSIRVHFPNGGTVTAVMKASGVYSVGFKAVCLD